MSIDTLQEPVYAEYFSAGNTQFGSLDDEGNRAAFLEQFSELGPQLESLDQQRKTVQDYLATLPGNETTEWDWTIQIQPVDTSNKSLPPGETHFIISIPGIYNHLDRLEELLRWVDNLMRSHQAKDLVIARIYQNQETYNDSRQRLEAICSEEDRPFNIPTIDEGVLPTLQELNAVGDSLRNEFKGSSHAIEVARLFKTLINALEETIRASKLRCDIEDPEKGRDRERLEVIFSKRWIGLEIPSVIYSHQMARSMHFVHDPVEIAQTAWREAEEAAQEETDFQTHLDEVARAELQRIQSYKRQRIVTWGRRVGGVVAAAGLALWGVSYFTGGSSGKSKEEPYGDSSNAPEPGETPEQIQELINQVIDKTFLKVMKDQELVANYESTGKPAHIIAILKRQLTNHPVLTSRGLSVIDVDVSQSVSSDRRTYDSDVKVSILRSGGTQKALYISTPRRYKERPTLDGGPLPDYEKVTIDYFAQRAFHQAIYGATTEGISPDAQNGSSSFYQQLSENLNQAFYELLGPDFRSKGPRIKDIKGFQRGYKTLSVKIEFEKRDGETYQSRYIAPFPHVPSPYPSSPYPELRGLPPELREWGRIILQGKSEGLINAFIEVGKLTRPFQDLGEKDDPESLYNSFLMALDFTIDEACRTDHPDSDVRVKSIDFEVEILRKGDGSPQTILVFAVFQIEDEEGVKSLHVEGIEVK